MTISLCIYLKEEFQTFVQIKIIEGLGSQQNSWVIFFCLLFAVYFDQETSQDFTMDWETIEK